MTQEIADALREFDSLIDASAYFEAHEVLEQVWIKAKAINHPQTLLLKGLINAAVSFEHLKRNRSHSLKSSRITIQAYYRYRHLITPDIEHYALYENTQDTIETHPYFQIIEG